MASGNRKTVAVDFDGVLHHWDGEWRGYHVIEGEPIKGAIEWLLATLTRYDVQILSTRALTWRGRRAIRSWLKKHVHWSDHDVVSRIKISAKKYPAIVYLDDRAMRFDGENWPSVQRIRGALPWWRVR